MNTPAVFLDRDGTLIKEKHYLHQPAEVEIENNVVPALTRLIDAGFPLFIITNQAGLAKGKFTLADYKATHAHLIDLFATEGIHFQGSYFCPFHKDGIVPEYSIESPMRKPEPGMLLKAQQEHAIDLTRSFMIGDKLIDVAAGQNCGAKGILVKTGYGLEESKHNDGTVTPDFMGKDLLDIVENYILK